MDGCEAIHQEMVCPRLRSIFGQRRYLKGYGVEGEANLFSIAPKVGTEVMDSPSYEKRFLLNIRKNS